MDKLTTKWIVVGGFAFAACLSSAAEVSAQSLFERRSVNQIDSFS